MAETTLMELLLHAREAAAPGSPVLPLVIRRLRRGRPGDAAARAELAALLGVGDDLPLDELAAVLPPSWLPWLR